MQGSNVLAESSPCGDWQLYENEKCVKIFNESKVLTYNEAEKACRKADNGFILITIHSIKEKEFIFDYVFKSHKIV